MSVSDIISSRKKKIESKHTHFFEANPFYHPSKPVWQGATTSGLVGLELEIEGNNLPTQVSKCFSASNRRYWRVERDGSLRNGLEYVLSGPISLMDVEPAVESLFNKFNEAELVLSDRCSTHVHINCDTAKLNEIVSLFCLWALFEDIVIPWCGVTRTGNHFCTPLSVSPDPIKIMQDACKTGCLNPAGGGRNLRYTAVNLYSFPKFGSVEFRSLRGAESPDMVVKWVKYLARLKELSTTTFANPRLIANYMSESGPVEFFRLLCEGNETFYEEVLETFAAVSSCSVRHTAFQSLYLIQPLLFDTDWPTFIEKASEPPPPENPFLKNQKARNVNRLRLEPLENDGQIRPERRPVLPPLVGRNPAAQLNEALDMLARYHAD